MGRLRARTCRHCGASFHARRSDARYCGPRCRVAVHREKHSGAMTPVVLTLTPYQAFALRNLLGAIHDEGDTRHEAILDMLDGALGE